jgi:hypothetical protein
MIYHWDIKQRSEQWDKLRLGIPTSSAFSRIVTPKNGNLSTQADGLMDELLAEWLFGGSLEDPESEYRSQWMQRGVFLEQQARSSYEFETGQTVRLCGFVTTDDGLIGASPDGIVGDYGGLELKVPSPKIHVGYMRTGKIEQDYRPQIQGLMLVTERAWWDVQSYCPPFPTKIIRVPRDEEYIGKLRQALSDFTCRMLEARAKMLYEYGPFLRPELMATVNDLAAQIAAKDTRLYEQLRDSIAAVEKCEVCGAPKDDNKLHDIPGNNRQMCSHIMRNQ